MNVPLGEIATADIHRVFSTSGLKQDVFNDLDDQNNSPATMQSPLEQSFVLVRLYARVMRNKFLAGG